MKKEQIFIIAQYLLIWILTGVLTTFIFPELWFLNFIIKYWLYILFFTCSYISYYLLKAYQEKKYQQIRQIILYFNIYLFAHIFFRPLLNITPELFLLLGTSIIIIFSLQKITLNSYIKTVSITLLSTTNILILISGLIYTYPEPPHIEQFIQKQSLQLITFSSEKIPPTQTYLKIYYPENSREENLFFQEGTFRKTLENNIQINFISIQQNIHQQTFLIFPNGYLLQLLPQTTTSINKEEKTYIIKQWPENIKASNLNLDENLISKNQKSSSEIYSAITHHYYTNLQNFLKNQIWWVFATSSISIRLSEKTLQILSKILPSFFSQNLKNFHEFKTFFQKDTPNNNILKKYSNVTIQTTFRNNLLQNIQLGIANSSSHKSF